MKRKVFISFLGTTDYKDVNYFYENKSLKTPVAPVASLKFFASDFDETSKVFFFVTEKAKQKNGDLLLQECKKHHLIEPVLIPIENENTQKNIWKNFSQIYEVLEEKDEIIFDITFGFRAVPMLFMVLANYAKFLLRVNISKILYGAYEVKDEYDGNTPIWDLTNFGKLQNWSESANNFINSGNSTELSKLISESASGNKDFTEFAEKLNDFTLSFNTCRGKNIFESDILNDLIVKSKTIQTELFPPLIPIIDELNNQMKKFDLSENLVNGFKAVEWCMKNNLTQQGITLLQESLKAFIAEENGLDYQIYEHMEIVGAAFTYNFKPWLKTRPNLKKYEKQIFEIKDTPHVQMLSAIYEGLRKLRNDINHAGLSFKAEKGIVFKEALASYYLQIKSQLKIN